MPKIHVERSITIQAPIDKVFKAVADLTEWPAWSPWLIMEPNVKVSVADDKMSYSWDGARVGSGHMALTESVKNKSTRYDLTFLKPWKSSAKVAMDLTEVEDGTSLTWRMDSHLPFFMFFMKKMMEAFIGMDYDRGLLMLKDYVQDGKVHSRLNFVGEHDYAGGNYVGLKRTCSLETMPHFMAEDFQRLMPWAAKNGMDVDDTICIYHVFDPMKGICRYTVALRCEKVPDNIPEDFVTGSQGATRIYTLEHVGPYEHLGNGWSTIHTMIRNKEIKVVKNYHPFETYGNSPEDTDPKDLITRINFAVQ